MLPFYRLKPFGGRLIITHNVLLLSSCDAQYIDLYEIVFHPIQILFGNIQGLRRAGVRSTHYREPMASIFRVHGGKLPTMQPTINYIAVFGETIPHVKSE